MNIIVLDLEFNQAFNFSKGKKVLKNDLCPFEVIQIGAVRLNKFYEIQDTFSVSIRPVLYARMHPYVEKITKISMANLQDKQAFSKVFLAFKDFCEADGDYFFGVWGDGDLPHLFRNMNIHHISPSTLSHQFINIQRETSLFLKKPLYKQVGLEKACEYLRIPKQKTFHDALHDAEYTATIMRKIQAKNQKIFTAAAFNPKTLLTKDLQKLQKKQNHRPMYNASKDPAPEAKKHIKPRQKHLLQKSQAY